MEFTALYIPLQFAHFLASFDFFLCYREECNRTYFFQQTKYSVSVCVCACVCVCVCVCARACVRACEWVHMQHERVIGLTSSSKPGTMCVHVHMCEGMHVRACG